MRITAFQKSAGRAVRSSATRFISIILISFLGAGIFGGLAAVSPNMKRVGDKYYDEQNVMDVRMLSTYGFTNEDVTAIRNTEGVSGVMASYWVDTVGTVADKDYVFRINGMPEANKSQEDEINKFLLVDGRLPENTSEAVIIRPSIGLKNIELGSVISLDERSNDAIPDTLDQMEYTIVGIAKSPYYLSFMQGNTSVSGGTIDYVLYVPQPNFIVDGYTDVYVTIAGAKEVNAFEDAYFDVTDATVERLEALADERQTIRRDEFEKDLAQGKQDYQDAEDKLADAEIKLADGAKKLDEAKQEYADGLTEYTDKKSEADQKMGDAKAELDEAAAKIADGETELAEKKEEYKSGEQKLISARKKLDKGWREYKEKSAELEQAKKMLAQSKEELDAGQVQYDAAATTAESTTGMTIAQIEAALPSMQTRLGQMTAQYNALSQLAGLLEARDAASPESEEYAALDQQYQAALLAAGLSEAEAAMQIAQLDAIEAQLESAQSQYEGLAQLIAQKNLLEGKWAEYNDGVAAAEVAKAQLAAGYQQLLDGEKEYSSGAVKLKEAQQKLAEAQNELVDGKQEYQEGLDEYNEQKHEADEKLSNAKEELDNAAIKIGDAEKELSEKQQEYSEKKAEADVDLPDAKEKIDDAEEKLSELGEPKWYVLDRHLNEAFETYDADTQRMHDLATVFPIVFFLVAALVCLTTMTRMVDEDRTLIGTFKALGYSNAQVAGRYLKYAASASFIGSVAGVAVGFKLIPTIIWGAYSIVFALPEMTPSFYFGIAAMAVFSTVFITTLSTGIAAKNSLRETPAGLMRPKAPKPGKRVFLEYVKPVWNFLTFTQKVTVRNLGLNKKRLLMSLVGILGCTALVVTAFGAKNAVKTILDDQFGDIFHYDLTVGFNDGEPSEQLKVLLADQNYFVKSTVVHRNSAEASLDEDSDPYQVYVVSPEAAGSFTDYVTLYNPETEQPIPFSGDSAIITEKLSMNLNVSVGDTILVKYLDEDEKYPVTITGITKNYAFNYIYLGSDAYKAAFGEVPEYNQFLTVISDAHSKEAIREYLAGSRGISAISFTDDLMGNIRTSISSVDKIIWVLIIAAGLLAFVVLYNLTNINIGERQREIATLKVLGFYDKETYNYIFRETVILSVVGCIVGLGCGVFLYRAVVTTVEPDMILLTRNLTWIGNAGAAVLTMMFTWIVNQCMKPRIRNIDMLESLKSVD